MATLGENIRRIRKEQKLSQEEVALSAGISQSTLSAIERDSQNPSIYIIRRISSALNCQSNILMKEDAIAYDPEALPSELVFTLSQMDPFELQRVQDFANGLIAGRRSKNDLSDLR